MRKFFGVLAAVLFANAAYGENLCENYAKFGAIQSYKEEMGVVQGSDGIQYSSKLLDNQIENEEQYLVSISDNNEDGETWTIHYKVKVSFDPAISNNSHCKLEWASKLGVVSPAE